MRFYTPFGVVHYARNLALPEGEPRGLPAAVPYVIIAQRNGAHPHRYAPFTVLRKTPLTGGAFLRCSGLAADTRETKPGPQPNCGRNCGAKIIATKAKTSISSRTRWFLLAEKEGFELDSCFKCTAVLCNQMRKSNV